MNGSDALRAALEQVQRQLIPTEDTAPVFRMITAPTEPFREGLHNGVFSFTMHLDRANGDPADDDEPAISTI